MTKECRKVSFVFFVLTCLVVSPAVMAIQVQQMQFSFEDLPYYSNQTLGFDQATTLNADVAIYTTGVYAYTITDAVVSLSDMALTSGGGTTGTFAGPATLTVTGNLIKNSTAASLTSGSVTLLVATMDADSFVMSQVFDYYAAGSALFTPTGGALLGGVADGSDLVKISNFGMGLWGYGTNVLFGTNNSMTPDEAGVQINAQIPEPLTISLLSMGLLILSRRRKNA